VPFTINGPFGETSTDAPGPLLLVYPSTFVAGEEAAAVSAVAMLNAPLGHCFT